MIAIRVRGQEALRREFRATRAQMEQAIPRALNDTARHVSVQSSREIRKTWNVSAQAVRAALVLRRATRERPEASITATRGKRGQGIPLTQFPGTRQTKPGVTYRVKKGAARGLVRGGFIATMKSGHRGVFVRRTTKRLPITERKVITIASMWEPVIGRLVGGAQAYLAARLRSQLARTARR